MGGRNSVAMIQDMNHSLIAGTERLSNQGNVIINTELNDHIKHITNTSQHTVMAA